MSATMIIEQNIAIPMRDGAILYGNVYRPNNIGRYPVIMTVGAYGKDLFFGERNPKEYEEIAEHGSFMNWETPNPQWWVPRGYVVVRVDQRGIGASPGWLALISEQEGMDFYDVIEWAAGQPWSTGKIGLLGVSYYAFSQWQVAALKPPHLSAMCSWECFSDFYRDAARHGGIYANNFLSWWFSNQVLIVQNGSDGSLSEEEQAAIRTDLAAEVQAHELDDESFRPGAPDLGQVTVPLLSIANWGSTSLHLRGSIEAYVNAASAHKWLWVIVGNHYAPFYTREAREVQKQFFDYWLMGEDNGWQDVPRIRLAIRKGSEVTWRDEQEWPLARTHWTCLFLDGGDRTLREQGPIHEFQVDYEAPSGGVRFTTAPFEKDIEITGPMVLRLWVSSTTNDVDLFVTVRNLDQESKEVCGIGQVNNPVPVSRGWLRVSHRKLDHKRSTSYRPYHTHDEIQKLLPGEIVPVDVEIWPTSMVFEAGHRLILDIEAHDSSDAFPFLHNDPDDRNPLRLAGSNTLYTGGERESFLLLPIIAS